MGVLPSARSVRQRQFGPSLDHFLRSQEGGARSDLSPWVDMPALNDALWRPTRLRLAPCLDADVSVSSSGLSRAVLPFQQSVDLPFIFALLSLARLRDPHFASSS